MSGMTVEKTLVPGADVIRYLDDSEHASIFHSAAWARVLARSYGHQTLFFVARHRESVQGVFVVVRQRMWPLGEKWVAMPYQFHGGPPVAEDPETAQTLIRAALEAARSARAKYLEVRTSRFGDVMQAEGLVRIDSGLQVTGLDLRTHDSRKIRQTTRHEVRYAAEGGVVIEHAPASEGMKAFLPAYLRDMRDFGTPQAGRVFFDTLVQQMPEVVHILLARRQGEVIGSVLVLGDRRAAFVRGFADTKTAIAREHYASKALTYAAIEAAKQRGVAHLSLGITWTGDSTLNAYKDGWRGTTHSVENFVAAITSEAPKAGDYFGGYQLARRIWTKMPMMIAGPVGHRVTRWIG